MSTMTEQDKVEVERWGDEFLGIMEDEDFSLAQKGAAIELMQKKLFPPLKLMIEGELVEIPSWEVMIFELNFDELKRSCRKNLNSTVADWLRKTGSDESIAKALRSSYLPALVTAKGIAFLKHKTKLNECAAAA